MANPTMLVSIVLEMMRMLAVANLVASTMVAMANLVAATMVAMATTLKATVAISWWTTLSNENGLGSKSNSNPHQSTISSM